MSPAFWAAAKSKDRHFTACRKIVTNCYTGTRFNFYKQLKASKNCFHVFITAKNVAYFLETKNKGKY